MTILEIVQTIIGIVGLPTAIFSVLLLARQTQHFLSNTHNSESTSMRMRWSMKTLLIGIGS